MNICLGSTLQINPSGSLAIKNKKYGGKLVICNLQPTKYDKKSDLVINSYVDLVMEKLCKRLGIEIPAYNKADDPTKSADVGDAIQEWTIPGEQVKEVEKLYNAKVKSLKKKRKPFTLDWDGIRLKKDKKEDDPDKKKVAAAALIAEKKEKN